MKLDTEKIESLKKVLEERKRKEEQAEKASEKERKEEIEKERKYKKWKLEKFPNSLKLSKLIFDWINDFLENETTNQIFRLKEGRIKRIKIFSDGYFNLKPGGFGTYAKIWINQDGIVDYREGYKWMGYCGKNIEFKKHKKFAEILDPRYIKSLHEHIASGKVWGYIEREIR